MNRDIESTGNIGELFEKAVETLATGTGHIQQRLADAYVRSHLGEEINVGTDRPADVYALQLDLQAALSTARDSERGTAMTSAGSLTDDQCIILARRILAAARTLRQLNQSEDGTNP